MALPNRITTIQPTATPTTIKIFVHTSGSPTSTALRYRYNAGTTAGGTWQTDSTSHGFGSFTVNISGLTKDTTYTIQLQSTNSDGMSPVSTLQLRTINTPSTPNATTATVVATNRNAMVSWTASSGSPTGYFFRFTEITRTPTGQIARTLISESDYYNLTTTTNPSYNFTGLKESFDYQLLIWAYNAGGWSGHSNTINIKTTTIEVNKPDPPRFLAGTAPDDNSINVSWFPPLKTRLAGGATYYQIRINGGSWILKTQTLHTFRNLTADTSYKIEVRAGNDVGVSASAVINVKTQKTPQVPNAPTNLVLAPAGNSIRATWTAPVVDATHDAATEYEIRIAEGSTAGGTYVSTQRRVYDFGNLKQATQYTVQLRAKNKTGTSSSIQKSATTLQTTKPPTVPTNVRTTNTHNSITMSWVAPLATAEASAAESYEVKIGDAAWVAQSSTAHVFGGLDQGKDFVVQVRAKNSAGVSPAVRLAAVTSVLMLDRICHMLTGLEADTLYTIQLRGSNDTGDGKAITIRASTLPGPIKRLCSEVTGLESATKYTLQVRGVGLDGEGPAGTVRATTLSAIPAAPTNLAATVTPTTMTVTWDAVPKATSYEVRIGSGEWIAKTTRTHTFTGLTKLTRYTVEVRAKNSAGTGTETAISATTTVAAPSAPTLTTSSTINSITATWQDVLDADKWQVRLDDNVWIDVAKATLTYTWTGLSSGVTHTVEVRGVNAGGDGESSEASVTTKTATPTHISALTGISTSTSITVSWTIPAGAQVTAYQHKIGSDSFANTGSLATNHTYTSLTPNTAYTIQIRAVNGNLVGDTQTITITTKDVVVVNLGDRKRWSMGAVSSRF